MMISREGIARVTSFGSRMLGSNEVDARVNHPGPSEGKSERDDRIDERKEKKRGPGEPSMTSHCCLIKPVNALPVIPPSWAPSPHPVPIRKNDRANRSTIVIGFLRGHCPVLGTLSCIHDDGDERWTPAPRDQTLIVSGWTLEYLPAKLVYLSNWSWWIHDNFYGNFYSAEKQTWSNIWRPNQERELKDNTLSIWAARRKKLGAGFE